MKPSIFCPFGLKTPIHAPKIGVLGGISPPKWGAISTKPPKGTSAGHSGSRGVLIMSISSIVPEKSREKMRKKRKKKNYDTFLGVFA